MASLKNEEILLKLKSTEDSFTERKTVHDLKDVLKTAVAFANTAPFDFPAIIFIGVTDSGEIEGVSDFEDIQKKINKNLSKAYPEIAYESRILERDDKIFLALLIRGSENRPHFAGQAFVRNGNESVVASERLFAQLISSRNGIVHEILKWKGKGITLRLHKQTFVATKSGQMFPREDFTCTIWDCNPFYVTTQSIFDGNQFASFPLRIIELSFDHRVNQLEMRLLDGDFVGTGVWTE